METLPGNFWTIAAVVLSAFALHFAAKADRRKDSEQAERRRAEGEKRLAEQIAQVDERAERRQGEGDKRLGESEKRLAAQIAQVDERAERRHEEGEKRLAGQIAQVDEQAEKRRGEGEKRLGARIDSLERRIDENHRELCAALAETRAAVKVLGAKLDERSRPRGIEGGGLVGVVGSGVSGASVREESAEYAAPSPKGESDQEAGEGEEGRVDDGFARTKRGGSGGLDQTRVDAEAGAGG